MRIYEILFIIAPNTEESDIETLVTQLSDVLTNQGAKVTKVDKMGRRRLAYQIDKFNEGIYIVLTVEGTGSEIAEVERRMRVTDAIIRYITVRIDEDLKRAEKFRARRQARLAARAGAGSPRRSKAPANIREEIAVDEEEDDE
jgi:small subunit ribosomal protein S6